MIMPTVRVAVVVFYSIVCIAFFIVFRAVCSASTRVRQRGTVAEGSAGTTKLRGLPENRVFRQVDFLTGLLSKSRLQLYFLNFSYVF